MRGDVADVPGDGRGQAEQGHGPGPGFVPPLPLVDHRDEQRQLADDDERIDLEREGRGPEAGQSVVPRPDPQPR
jgi:hypothetical protein